MWLRLNNLYLVILLISIINQSRVCFAEIDEAKFAIWINAIAQHESGNKNLPPHNDVNGKKVIGKFQISQAFWQDATNFDKTLGGRWEDLQNNPEYGVLIIRAYMKKWVPQALENNDFETMSRSFNGGGPSGAKKTATIKYWLAIKKLMNNG